MQVVPARRHRLAATLAGAATVAATALALFASTARAQAPSSWTPLSPPGGTNPAALQFSKTLILYRDGLYLRVYSAITRKWYAQQPSFGTTPQLRDHLLAVPESHQWTAFSAHRGTFEVLPINLAVTTWAASESMFVVRDGDAAHVFSTYTGHWHTHTVPASWSMQLEERIVLFGDFPNGTPSAGAALFDGFSGQWHDIAGRNERLVAAVSGGSALLMFENEVLAYSAQRPTFQSLPVAANLAGGSFVRNNRTDLVDHRGAAWSGVTGGWVVPPYPPQPFPGNSPTYWTNGLVVRAALFGMPWYVSGTGNAWVPLTVNSVPSGEGVSWMAFRDGSDVHAFSAMTNQFAPRTFSAQVNPTPSDHVAAFIEPGTGLPSFFSGITGQWHDAPPGTVPVAGPIPNFGLGDTGALLPTTTGLAAFSARSGASVPLPGTGLERVTGHSSAMGAWDGTDLFVFDATKDRWLQTPLQVSAARPPLVSTVGWPSTTLLAEDGTRAVGFAARSGRLDVLPLSEPVLDRGVLGDLAWVRTASTIHAFSGFGCVLPWAGFPDDLVGVGRGGTLHDQLRLPAGDLALLGIGPRASAPIALPPFGLVWLDPPFASVRFIAAVPGADSVVFELPLPADPVFANSEWFVQALVAPATGAAYLGEPSSFRIF